MTVKCASSRLLRISGFHLARLVQRSQPSSWVHSSSGLQSLSDTCDLSQNEPKKSYHYELATSPLVNWTFGECLNVSATMVPDKIAYTFEELKKNLTFAEFRDEVDRCAKGLLAAGLSKGDCLMIFAPNIANWIVMFTACSKIGVLSASVHPAYTKQEFFNAVDKVKPKAIFITESFKATNFYENLCKWIPELNSSPPGQLSCARFPTTKIVIVDSDKSLAGTVNMKEILQQGQADTLQHAEAKVGCDDPLTIIFTSGTTGPAKAACLVHHSFLNICFNVTELLRDADSPTVILNPLPFFHVFGLMNATFPLITRERAVLPSTGYDQAAILQCIEKYKCTRMTGSPTMYIDLINHPDWSKYDLSSITHCIMGGAVCTPETRELVEKKFNCTAIVGYGATETSTVATLIRPEDPAEKRRNTVGRPVPHVEVKVADPETGIEVPRHTTGELWVRGFNIFQGYFGDEAKTNEVITPARWYRSGDVGCMDNEGFVSIVGRIKDLIIRGGENIHPIDIETELDTHPAVEESHIVAVPDQRMGEELCAVVVLREGAKVTAEELQQYLKDKVAYFKIPKYVLFELDVPKTAIGKVQKSKLRKIAAEKLQL